MRLSLRSAQIPPSLMSVCATFTWMPSILAGSTPLMRCNSPRLLFCPPGSRHCWVVYGPIRLARCHRCSLLHENGLGSARLRTV